MRNRLTAILCGVPVLAALLAAQTPTPRLPDDPAEAKLALDRARAFLIANSVPQAREAALAALARYQQLNDEHGIGAASHVLGEAAWRMGDEGEAKVYFTRAIAAFGSAGDLTARSLSELGLAMTWPSDRQEKRDVLADALSDARAGGSKGVEGRVLHALGDNLFILTDYQGALDRLEEAAGLFDVAGERDALGSVYNSLGRLYRIHGRLDVALEYQLKALAIHENSKDGYYHLQSLNAVAVTYHALGNLVQARVYMERAMAMASKTGAPKLQDVIAGNLASMLCDQGDYQGAARLLEQAAARGVDPYPSPHYSTLSYAYWKLGRREDALATAEKSLAACGNQDQYCVAALNARAFAHAGLGDDDAALADIRGALDRIEHARAHLVPSDLFKQQFNLAMEDIYSHAIALQMKQKRTRDALETAELARGRALIDLLADHQVAAKSDATGASPVPRGLRSGVSAPTATVDDLIATAARLGSTILTYWVSDDAVSIWVVKPDGRITSAQIEVRRAKLAELIKGTSPFSEERRATQSASRVATRGLTAIELQRADPAVWRELYDLLIRPIRGALPRAPGALITIVPHGPLAALSFAALQNENGRYLLEDYALHYVPAGAVLQFTSAQANPQARTGRVLLVADPDVSQSRLDQPLSPLSGARAEVRAISQLLPPRRVTLLEGARATDSNVKTASIGPTVLHFATHAFVRDDDPFASYLALARTAGAQASDGHLTAQEIYGLTTNADLVVLSACRSGGGRVTGDGIATLARAFIYSGAASLVTSLWDVADEPTKQLVPEFYRSWFGGASKARALRAAQLHVLRELRAGRMEITTPAGPVTLPEYPVFWAGLALIGEPN